MGNWVTLEALRQMAIRDGRIAPKIKTVLLASPNVNVDKPANHHALGPQRPKLSCLPRRTTKHWPCRESSGEPLGSAGSTRPQEPYKSELAREHIEVIDLSGVQSPDKFGHGTYAGKPEGRGADRPNFRDKLPDVDFDNLTFWHHSMVEILDEINLAAEKFEKNDQPETEMRNIENALRTLNEWWPLHIKPETDDFIDKADALVPVEEQLRLVRVFAEHSLKLAVPHHLTVPFMLFNLPVVDRKVFSQGMPAEFLQNLVPVVWKEKWASMTPYLLA